MEKVNTTPPCKDPQTHDFMNVDSFSQLPFLRPSTTTTAATTIKAAATATATANAVRLFGIDFSSSNANSDSDESTADNQNEGGSPDPSTTTTNTAISGGESGRRFECHYCCRNFPTSQALGGHQNAHKRERQHAKRAHLHHHHAAVISASGDHLYGYPHYYSSLTTSRTYSGFTQHRHNHQAPPTIDGSPLGVWRIPASGSMQLNGTYHRDRSLLLQRPGLYSGSMGSFSGPKIMMGRIENSGQVVGFDHHRTEHHQFNRLANGHENVSLDLRL